MEESASTNKTPNNKCKLPFLIFFKDARDVFKMDSLAKEILRIAFPCAVSVAADPIASLIDTAFIGHLGPVELAAAGVAIALLNQASKITVFPLVSITTSFVAEEDTTDKMKSKQFTEENIMAESVEVIANDHILQHKENSEITTQSLAASGDTEDLSAKTFEQENMERDGILKNETNNNEEGGNKNMSKISCVSNKSVTEGGRKKRQLDSASTALLFGLILGLLQAAILIFAAKPLLRVMGQKDDSETQTIAIKYLRLRSSGAPAVLLFLAMQGIFRGFKDTTTPLYVIVLGYALNITLDPILIFVCKLGINGAAIAHVLSQYIMALALLLILMRRVVLLPPSIKDLQIFKFLKNGGLVFSRVVTTTFSVTLASSLASRLGPIPMAAFQTCLQVWLASSLLSEGLAIAVQATLACSFAEKDYGKVIAAATRSLQMSFVLGVGLAFSVGFGLYFGAAAFSKNDLVVHIIRIGVPYVAATQPVNTLAFVFDGVNYGASDFAYSSYSVVSASIATIASLLVLYRSKGFVGIWIGLGIHTTLRTIAGLCRMGTGSGPWRFLRGCSSLSC